MSLPKNAKKVYNGQIFTVYEREQKLFDGSVTTFEAIERPDTVKVIATLDGKIIMAEEQQPHMDHSYHGLIGGRADDGEQPIESAKRELLEETGMIATNRKQFKSYSLPGKILQNSVFFVAQNCEKIQEQKLDAGEKIKIYTMTFDEFVDFMINKAEVTISDSGLIIDLLKMKVDGNLEKFKKEIFG